MFVVIQGNDGGGLDRSAATAVIVSVAALRLERQEGGLGIVFVVVVAVVAVVVTLRFQIYMHGIQACALLPA